MLDLKYLRENLDEVERRLNTRFAQRGGNAQGRT
jgi:hypothetical protein